jgi:hypothetical protein
MTTFKGRRVALSCAQGIVYIKVILRRGGTKPGLVNNS